ncbi:MAG: heme-copper oxidase subunit III [Candidatus Wallbacteria bacterium]|nr:heme-copper oxidase subunit III [Candidatus Wallbacteria bacterium]
MEDVGLAPGHAHATAGTGVPDGKLGIWIFLASEVMFFAGLIGSYIVLRFGTARWPVPSETLNIPLTGFNTFLLICSSVTMVKALSAAHRDDQAGIRKFLGATVGLGCVFLSIQAYEYYSLSHHAHGAYTNGFLPWSDIFGSTFYTMTGFHGAHVTGGVIWLGIILLGALQGRFGSRNYMPIELAGLYWHFVDLVWIILFTIVYLV